MSRASFSLPAATTIGTAEAGDIDRHGYGLLEDNSSLDFTKSLTAGWRDEEAILFASR
jgi:hypothetical protein